MKYIFLNIRNLIRNEKFIFAVMLVCIFVSAWIMTFSYGLYQNYYSMRVEGEIESREISPTIAKGETLTKGEFALYLNSLPDSVLNEMNVIYCSSMFSFEHSSSGSNYMIDVIAASRFTVHDGEFHNSQYILDIWNKRALIASGRYFDDSEEANGVRCAMIPSYWYDSGGFSTDEAMGALPNESSYTDIITEDGKVKLFGEDYEIIGTHSSNGVVVPFLSLPNDVALGELTMSFENSISRKSYDELKYTASSVIPGKLIFPELPFPDEETIYIYNNIMLISVLIAALSVTNFALLYDFIFKKRRRQFAIMRICGCTGLRVWGMCLGECCMMCVPVFLLGMATFIPFMHGFLSDIFIYMEDSYTPVIYAAIFAIYMIMLLIIMGVKLLIQINKTLSEAQKKGVG